MREAKLSDVDHYSTQLRYMADIIDLLNKSHFQIEGRLQILWSGVLQGEIMLDDDGCFVYRSGMIDLSST